MVYLVVGASGQQGGAVARELLSTGQQVRLFTRDPQKVKELKKMGCEVAVGDLNEPDSIRDALQGVTCAFLATFTMEGGPAKEIEHGYTFIRVAEEVGLPHLVFSSVSGADMAPNVAHMDSKWKVEQELRDSLLQWTVLRPSWFMENFGSPLYTRMLEQGKLLMALPAETKLAMVAVRDIGKAGARAMLHPEKFAGRTFQLAGDELTMAEITEAISATLGKPIGYQQLPDEEVLKAMGQEMLNMFHWMQEVGFSLDPRVSEQLGFELTRFEEYLATAPWIRELASAR
jgi:uncharacterized protein YbjT (DUF2867 family)